MAQPEGGKAPEMWGIFKLFRRAGWAFFTCPQDFPVALRAVVKSLPRATSPLFATFLASQRHRKTLRYGIYEFMT